MRYTAASSLVSMPTSRSGGSSPPPDLAMICSSMAGASLQPHPPPWERLVSRAGVRGSSMGMCHCTAKIGKYQQSMNLQAQTIWDSLEFRTPAILAAVDRVSEQEFQWLPPNGANPIAWLLWHIAEVEDNWVRDKLLVLPRRYPFE